MGSLTAAMPCYNEYPVVNLAVEAALHVCDEVVVMDSSDDAFTWDELRSRFGKDERVRLEHSDDWLDWARARDALCPLVKTSHTLWIDANDVLIESKAAEIRGTIFGGPRDKRMVPRGIRGFLGWTGTDLYHYRKHGTCIQKDAIHCATATGISKGWRLAGSGAQMQPVIDTHDVMQPWFWHYSNMQGLERMMLRNKLLRKFLASPPLRKSYKNPTTYAKATGIYKKQRESYMAWLRDLYRPLAALAKVTGDTIPEMPRVIQRELNDPRYLKLEVTEMGVPVRRTLLHEGEVIEELRWE